MKRTLALACSATMVLGLAACGGDTGTETPADETTAEDTATDEGTADGDAAATGDDSSMTSSGEAAALELPDLSGEELEVAGVWTGAEQDSFGLVLDAFEEKTGATVQYTSTGDDIAPVLTPRVEGGNPPDVAMLPQPGLLTLFAEQGALVPVGPDVEAAIDANYEQVWKDLGTVDGDLYGVWFKAANKSTIWYDVEAIEAAGISTTPPEDWDWPDLKDISQTIEDSGVTPWAVAGADGWTLTDWFENIYLSQAGPELYDKLTAHEIKWTHPSVDVALTTLAEVWGEEGWVAPGALQTDFPGSVTTVFGSHDAAMVYEGDFVAGVIGSETDAVVGQDADFWPFPAVGEEPAVVGGGDVAVGFTDSEATMALLEWLASPESAEIWVQEGGFTSPNKNVDTALYPDDISRGIAESLIAAGDAFRFDMSDQMPPEFGGTPGAGMWQDLTDFLRDPTSVQETMESLEANAAKAYGD
ncbi:ABC transporter substrate-binding protein [Ornithinimicrobium avium]|uniref:Carbohydrate ABC transporter substrate-binding protein n=1 Tax=Ornithinimicrobium avium TaxID=2283195 RepID=A0A345NPE6_9MICO|nr:ABC transporter substrate-binding protein [Ornithinimicrobium avium]AXH96904.1 carbohydrate ABC transporter substrate-binding protein [Ornithinimicrobium avium]